MKLTDEGIKAHLDGFERKGDNAVMVAMTTVNTMIGGGLLGNFAVNQPNVFYIDSRVGKLPYPKRDIKQAVVILAAHRRRNPSEYEMQVTLWHTLSFNMGYF